jgi:hypothetical protein
MKAYQLWVPLLTVLFVGLKLTGNIAWSWWWVLSPIWIPFAAVLVFIAILSLFALIHEVLK